MSATIDSTIIFLQEHGIESFEKAGILVVPVSSPDEIVGMVSKLKGLFKECGYEKSWSVDPYYVKQPEILDVWRD